MLTIPSTNLVGSGTIELPKIKPGKTADIEIPLEHYNAQTAGRELWLTLTFQLRHSTPWAEAGHTVNVCQERLQKATQLQPATSVLGKLSMSESQQSILVEGTDFSVQFHKARATITQWSVRGQDVLQSEDKQHGPLSFGFWRAPTDNDAAWQSAEWKKYGLDMMQATVLSCKTSVQPNSQVVISCTADIMPPVLAWGFKAVYDITIRPNASISIKAKLTPFGSMPKSIPRIGMELQLPARFDAANWFGLGPGESYIDKKGSQWVAIHSASLEELQTRYDVPQEYGNHVDTRWLKVTDAFGHGLAVGYESEEHEYFEWALMKYGAECLEKAKHPCDLIARKGPLLRLDCRNAPLGTAACGPGPREDFKVPCRAYEFQFTLRAT